MRAILADLRAMMKESIDRVKYLEIETFSDVRSMRAIFCGVLPQGVGARMSPSIN